MPLSYAPWRFFFVFFYLCSFFQHSVARSPTGGTFVSYWLGVCFRAISERPFLAGPCFSGRCRRISLGFAFCCHTVAGRFGAFAGVAVWLWGLVCRHRALAAYPLGGKLGGFLLLAFFGLQERWRVAISDGFSVESANHGIRNWVYAAQPVAWVGIHGLGLIALIAAALIAYPAWRSRLAGLSLIVAVFAAGAAGRGAGNHSLSDR